MKPNKIEKTQFAIQSENHWKTISDSYYQSNYDACLDRKKWFANYIKDHYQFTTVLEVGFNEGTNLRMIHNVSPEVKICGIELHENAFHFAKSVLPEDSKLVLGNMYDLQDYFEENEVDLLFTMGVIIHVPPGMNQYLAEVFSYISKKYIIHIEDHDAGNDGAKISAQDLRWIHSYTKMYENINCKIRIGHDPVVDANGGANHLIEVILNKGE